MTLLGVGRHHNVFTRVLLIFFLRRKHPFPRLHHALRMADTGAHLKQHRRIEFFRKLIGKFRKGKRLRGIGRLQHGNLGRLRIMSGILFVLGTVHAGIIRHADHQSGMHSRIRYGKKRIRRHVKAYMLHGTEASLSGKTCTECCLKRHLLIGRPLRVQLLILRRALRDLRAGRSRIAGYEAAASFIKTSGNRLVAEHQCFHISFSSFIVFPNFDPRWSLSQKPSPSSHSRRRSPPAFFLQALSSSYSPPARSQARPAYRRRRH